MAYKRGFKRYTNGYEAWWIKDHPHEKILRDVRRGIFAFPEEKIVVMHHGAVVVFLETIDDLDKLEKDMHLTVEDVYFGDEDITKHINDKED